MGSFLTSKSQQTNKIDPTLDRESQSLMKMFRILAGQEQQFNRGVTVADFTPQQRAAMESTQSAAGAFGMPQANPVDGMPEAQMSASGIRGFSIAPEVDASKAALPQEFRSAMQDWRKLASTPTKVKKHKTGGKK
jgi:hypothetical protein